MVKTWLKHCCLKSTKIVRSFTNLLVFIHMSKAQKLTKQEAEIINSVNEIIIEKYPFFIKYSDLFPYMVLQLKHSYRIGEILDKANYTKNISEQKSSFEALKQILSTNIEEFKRIQFVLKNTRKKNINIDSLTIINELIKALKESDYFKEFMFDFEDYLTDSMINLTGRPELAKNKKLKDFAIQINSKLDVVPGFKSENHRFKFIADMINIVKEDSGHTPIDYQQIRIWIKPTSKGHKPNKSK